MVLQLCTTFDHLLWTALSPLQFQGSLFVYITIPHTKPIHLKSQKDIKHAQQILNEQQNSLQESCPRVPQILWLWEVLGFQTHFSSSQTLIFLSDFFRWSSMCSEFASIQWIYMKNSLLWVWFCGGYIAPQSRVSWSAMRTERLNINPRHA